MGSQVTRGLEIPEPCDTKHIQTRLIIAGSTVWGLLPGYFSHAFKSQQVFFPHRFVEGLGGKTSNKYPPVLLR